MKDTQVINILNVTLLKVQCKTKLLRQKVKCIQSLGLRFGDWGDIFASREMQKSSKPTTSILNYDPLGSVSMCRCVVEKWLETIRLFGITVSTEISFNPFPVFVTYPSKAQSSARVLIISGLVLASSLYTLQLLASLLSPP